MRLKLFFVRVILTLTGHCSVQVTQKPRRLMSKHYLREFALRVRSIIRPPPQGLSLPYPCYQKVIIFPESMPDGGETSSFTWDAGME